MAKTKTRTVYRRRTKKRRKPGFSLPPVAVMAGLAVPAVGVMTAFSSGGWQAGLYDLANRFTGYDWQTGQWNFAPLAATAIPILGGLLVSKLATRLGVNAMLRRALPVRI